MMADSPSLEIDRSGEALVLRARGSWVIGSAVDLDRRLRKLQADSVRNVTIELSGVEALDTTGAWLVVRTKRVLAAQGHEVELIGLPSAFEPLLAQVDSDALDGKPMRHPRSRFHGFAAFLNVIGFEFVRVLTRGRDLVGFMGLVSVVGLRTLRNPSRLRVPAVINQMERTAVTALPIIGLLSFLIGVVFAYQGADQLRRFGAEIYTVNLLGIGILRELGVLMTAIIVAGRSGSAFTAEIGAMKVNEEVDAMRTLGLDPIEVLVLPRLLALVLMLPLLVFYANFMGLLGGALMSWGALGIPIPAFMRQLQSALFGWTFWLGVMKAPFFAVIIALTGCYEGLRVSRSAESVGRLTTTAVVESLFLVILVDACFSLVFAALRI